MDAEQPELGPIAAWVADRTGRSDATEYARIHEDLLREISASRKPREPVLDKGRLDDADPLGESVWRDAEHLGERVTEVLEELSEAASEVIGHGRARLEADKRLRYIGTLIDQ